MGIRSDLLISILQIALNHKAFDQIVDFGIIISAVKHLLNNPDLLQILFVGVGMVRINDGGRILQVMLIRLREQDQVLVMIVGNELPCLFTAPLNTT